MWNYKEILEPVVQKTGLTADEIRKTSWGDIEDRLKIEKVSTLGLTIVPLRILTRKEFLKQEKEVMDFLESF